MQTRRLPRVRGLLPPSGKKQPGAWLPHAGFHALIGRIFSAALQCDFDTGGIVSSRRDAACRRQDAFGAIFRLSLRTRKMRSFASHAKGSEVFGAGKKREMRGTRVPECRGPTGRQEGSTIHADSQRFHSPAERRKKMSVTHHHSAPNTVIVGSRRLWSTIGKALTAHKTK